MNLENLKIAVIGTGLMAHGIAQEFAQNGYKVQMVGRSQESLTRATDNINNNLKNLLDQNLITNDIIETTKNNLSTILSINEIDKDTNIIIESVLEDLKLKQDLFEDLEKICSKDTIFTSNTSSFKPTLLAEKMKNPERFLNTHYFNPPQLVPLVEIVKGEKTDHKYAEFMHNLYLKIGKKPVTLKKEFPGFIANRLQIAVLREALHIVQEGVADASDVDTVISNSIGRRWAVAGVFEVCELAGLDLFLKISEELQPSLNSSGEPLNILKEKVKNGEFGAKSGQGFYDWSNKSATDIRAKIAKNLLNMN